MSQRVIAMRRRGRDARGQAASSRSRSGRRWQRLARSGEKLRVTLMLDHGSSGRFALPLLTHQARSQPRGVYGGKCSLIGRHGASWSLDSVAAAHYPEASKYRIQSSPRWVRFQGRRDANFAPMSSTPFAMPTTTIRAEAGNDSHRPMAGTCRCGTRRWRCTCRCRHPPMSGPTPPDAGAQMTLHGVFYSMIPGPVL